MRAAHRPTATSSFRLPVRAHPLYPATRATSPLHPSTRACPAAPPIHPCVPVLSTQPPVRASPRHPATRACPSRPYPAVCVIHRPTAASSFPLHYVLRTFCILRTACDPQSASSTPLTASVSATSFALPVNPIRVHPRHPFNPRFSAHCPTSAPFPPLCPSPNLRPQSVQSVSSAIPIVNRSFNADALGDGVFVL